MNRPEHHEGFHFRGRLPHLKRPGATYFVTMRLNDSLPREVVLELKAERERLQNAARLARRPLTWHEEQELFRWYSERVDHYLDSGLGSCCLRQPEIALLQATALNFFAGERYVLGPWVIMPNHVHLLVQPLPGWTLSQILHSWKSYTSKEIAKMIQIDGPAVWQKESYNHIIRTDDEEIALGDYVIRNPVDARLCARPEDWQWSSAHPEAARFQRQSP